MWVIRFCSVVSVFVGLVFGVGFNRFGFGCSRDLDLLYNIDYDYDYEY